MCHCQHAQRSNRVDEQRVWTVERVDVASLRDRRPACGLHRARDLERQLVKLHLAWVGIDLSLAHEAAQVSVGRDVVEPVIVHADVRDVRGHALHCPPAADFQKPLIAGRVELQHRRAELKSLRPLCPTARGVLPLLSEYRSALGCTPAFLNRQNFPARQVKESFQLGKEFFRGQLTVDFDRHVKFVES